MTPSRGLSRLDALLLLATLIWGSNYTVIKAAFQHLPPAAFNAARLVLASATFLVVIAVVQRRAPSGSTPAWWSILRTDAPLTRRDWLELALVGIIGHFLYQICLMGSLVRTSVANASLIVGLTPATIALASALLGRERLRSHHWIGLSLSLAGLYFIVGRGARFEGTALAGDGLAVLSVLCWTAYTLMSQRLMERHSPLGVTGLSMALGTVLYAIYAGSELAGADWRTIGLATWAGLVYSAMFSVCLSYMIWYVAVRQIGGARTSVYSNVIPVVAMAVAYLWLDEPVGWVKVVGALAVLGGVAITRLERLPFLVPAEE